MHFFHVNRLSFTNRFHQYLFLKSFYTSLQHFISIYYLEALETPPIYRKMGYASQLLKEIIAYLHTQGPVDIRDCVNKTNAASLATHKKCGFVLAEENGIYYPSGTVNPKTYGMRYTIQ